MLAEIVSGERDAADLLLLIAAVLFGVAILIHRNDTPAALGLAGWCLIAVALFIT